MTVELWRHGSAIIGSATIDRIPVTELTDFRCQPDGLVTFAMAQRIGEALSRNETVGEIDSLQWKLDAAASTEIQSSRV